MMVDEYVYLYVDVYAVGSGYTYIAELNQVECQGKWVDRSIDGLSVEVEPEPEPKRTYIQQALIKISSTYVHISIPQYTYTQNTTPPEHTHTNLPSHMYLTSDPTHQRFPSIQTRVRYSHLVHGGV